MALTDGLLFLVCDILRPTLAQVARGGQHNTAYTVVASKVPCLIDQASEADIDHMGGKEVNMTHIGYFDIAYDGTVIQTNDVLTNVAPMDNPANIDKDNFGQAGWQPRQYRVINPKVPNHEPDHVEVGLAQMQGRAAVPG